MGTWLRAIEGRNRPRRYREDMPLAAYLYDLAEAAERAEGWTLAEQLYLRCARIDPNDALACFHQARMVRRQDRPEEAAILFRNATESIRRWRMPGSRLASWRTNAATGTRPASISPLRSHASRATWTRPFHLAVTHLDRGDVRSALPLFERYGEQDPDGRWRRAAFRAPGSCQRPADTRACRERGLDLSWRNVRRATFWA